MLAYPLFIWSIFTSIMIYHYYRIHYIYIINHIHIPFILIVYHQVIEFIHLHFTHQKVHHDKNPFNTMEATSIKRLKTQKDIVSLLPLPDGIHALATVNGSNQIWKVNVETGEMFACLGEEGRGRDDGKPDAATFYWPEGLAMKSDGSVIVSDICNHLIREISPCGK